MNSLRFWTFAIFHFRLNIPSDIKDQRLKKTTANYCQLSNSVKIADSDVFNSCDW